MAEHCCLDSQDVARHGQVLVAREYMGGLVTEIPGDLSIAIFGGLVISILGR